MMNPAGALRGRVIEKYGTVGNFAKAMNWSARKASYVTTGRQELTIKEAEKCAEILEVKSLQEFKRIFFPGMTI